MAELIQQYWHHYNGRIYLALRIALFILTVSLGIVILLLGTRTALAASLKNVSMVEGEAITLGDLFSGLKQNADFVLGPAPKPGEDMVLNARTLYRIAVAMNLPWRPSDGSEKITLRRVATVVSSEKIKSALKKSIQNQGLQGRFSIHFSEKDPQMILPKNVAANIFVKDINYDAARGSFEAELAGPSLENPQKTLFVSGYVERIIAVPVLKNPIRKGTIIGAYDIEWVDMREDEVHAEMMLKADDIVNMTPRRMIFAGKPVLENELESPVLVERGDTITMAFDNGPLALTAEGRALQSGAKGDTIRISNMSSNKSVEGIVIAQGIVKIQ